MAFSTSSRFQGAQSVEVTPGPRYNHLKAFQQHDSRLKRTAAFSFSQHARFSKKTTQSHPGMAYTPNFQVGKTKAKRTVFSSSARFRYQPSISPGPKYNGDRNVVKENKPRAVLGTEKRFPKDEVYRLPGPRYESSSAFSATKPRTPGAHFGVAERGSRFGKWSNTPGPNYTPEERFTSKMRSSPSAAFGTAKRW
eukprot:CAMPEP_0184483412 /NCGR_PEP_ID=MMETSP0113_2-20130426/5066_1 /TAXON_ID=91329 /ORGANISM="Norrisiella sphaerica, Strain BC52" /LENGTH=194 /DNA_ID=CAMNT_0026863793 /DNA_START=222 /DNA_END=803 /DNA_ORIENTATION=-